MFVSVSVKLLVSNYIIIHSHSRFHRFYSFYCSHIFFVSLFFKLIYFNLTDASLPYWIYGCACRFKKKNVLRISFTFTNEWEQNSESKNRPVNTNNILRLLNIWWITCGCLLLTNIHTNNKKKNCANLKEKHNERQNKKKTWHKILWIE